MDQCSRGLVMAGSSSFTASQTETTTSSALSTSSMCRGTLESIGRPMALAARRARGFTLEAGAVPAEAHGTVLNWRHIASASTERAELWVQTKTTRGARSLSPASTSGAKAGQSCIADWTYQRRRSCCECALRISPTCCSTRR